jgi:2-keto-3-deoxy-L-rhamnonate aldolase RhmA
MQQDQTFKKRLSGGPPAIGCWLELFSPMAAEIVAQAGYDCVLIDLEHGPGSYLDAISLMHAVQGRPCASLLRVAANDPVEIKRAVDIGIAGIMVPVVDSRAEAEAAVASCRYPPAGRRGVAPIIVRAADYGADWRDYVDRANDELLIIAQIESRQAVENAAEIASVEGVDMIFLGPFDLSANLGHMGEPDHPETRAAVEAVEASVKAAGKLLGGLPTPARSAEELYEAGYNLVLADFDAALLRDGARARVATLRAASRNAS